MALDDSVTEINCDRFIVRPSARQLIVDGEPVALGGRAFDLLLALLERRERLVGKDELLDLVWPGLVVEENNLQVQISALRKALGPGAIATVPGRGYRFTAGAARAPAPAGRPTGSLPLLPGPLFGRHDELQALVGMLRSEALVTVVGAGGMGKSTIARAAAAALHAESGDAVWLVELAALADPALLPHAVARVLGCQLSGEGDAACRQLCARLSGQRGLIVLDSCEHMIDAAAALAAALRAGAPELRLLATSQQPLKAVGERLFPLEPLSLPARGELPQAERHGAVALFLARAVAVDPRFALDANNADDVAEVCRQLDGLPLAIELAAARVRLLGARGLRERLGERLRLLTRGARTTEPRHQTLRATLDWSHQLLSAPERSVLRRLGTFVGGFTLDLAQRMAADETLDEWAVLDALASLVDKSLVIADPGETPRYRLLESTRAYAMERLIEAGERALGRDRHLQALREHFEQTAQQRFEQGLAMPGYMARLAPELDNLRSALDWACGDGADPATAVALAAHGADLFSYVGCSLEGLARCLPLRAHVERAAPADVAAFWSGLAVLGTGGRLSRAALFEAVALAVQAWREQGSRRRLFDALCTQARTLTIVGEVDAADRVLAEARGLRQADDPTGPQIRLVCGSAAVAWKRQRHDEALQHLRAEEAHFALLADQSYGLQMCRYYIAITLYLLGRCEEALDLADELVDHWAPQGIGDVCHVALCKLAAELGLGRLDAARRTLRRFLPDWRHDGTLGAGLGVVALLLAERGLMADAVRLDGASLAWARQLGGPLDTPWHCAGQSLEQRLAAAGLDAANLEQWRSEGERLDEAAITVLCQRACGDD